MDLFGNTHPPAPVSFVRSRTPTQSGTSDPDEDRSATPTHIADECEICKLHLQHLSLAAVSLRPAHGHDQAMAGQSFEDGVKLGLRLQKENDDRLLDQYRKRLRIAEAERDISRRARYDAQRLERELEEAREMLEAVSASYEEKIKDFTASDHRDYGTSAVYDSNKERDGGAVLHNLSHTAADTPPGYEPNTSVTPFRNNEVPSDTVGTSSSIEADMEDDDADLWEQLKTLDEQNREKFWKNVYGIDRVSPSRPNEMESVTDHFDIISLASADESQNNDCAPQLRSPSPRPRVGSSRLEGHHSDGEESTYSFL